MNIFVGGLSWDTNEDDLKSLFEQGGQVNSVKIITDHETGKSRGFGFVEMENDDEAQATITKLDGGELDGRSLRVSKAKPKEQKPARY